MRLERPMDSTGQHTLRFLAIQSASVRDERGSFICKRMRKAVNTQSTMNVLDDGVCAPQIDNCVRRVLLNLICLVDCHLGTHLQWSNRVGRARVY